MSIKSPFGSALPFELQNRKKNNNPDALVTPNQPQKKRFGSALPSYDVGTPYVPEDQVAQIHKGEEVVPADQNPNNPDNLVATDAKPSAFGSVSAVAPAKEVDEGNVKRIPKLYGPQQTQDDKNRALIQADKEEASKKGDLVSLGNAVLAERHAMPETGLGTAAAPVSPLGSAMPRYTGPNAIGTTAPAPGELISPKAAATDEALFNAPKTQEEVKARKAELRAQILDAESHGDHVGAGNAKVALEELNRFSPWGTALNHPGFLGKVAHVASRIGNAAGDIFDPAAMTLIPGTDLHNAAKERSAFGEVNFGNEQAEKEALAKLQSAEADAKRADINSPKGTPEEITLRDLMTGGPNGTPRINPDTQKPYSYLEAYGAISQAKADTKLSPANTPLGANVDSLNKTLTDRFQVLNPGKPLPAQYQLPANATQADYERVDKALEQVEKATGTKAQQDTVNEMRREAEQAQKDKQSAATEQKAVAAVDKAYVQPANTVEKSFQMMNNAYQEYEAARAQGKSLPTGAQSMLALSTHLSTTFGNVKGARVTKDMIAEHLGARGISDKALVAVQKLTNGDVLSPDQWDAFHELIAESRNLSWNGAVREAARKNVPIDFLPDDLTAVKIPGHNPAVIPNSSLPAFKRKYPNGQQLSTER